ncbi:hypothetical protein, partial [Streptomyces sp. ME18-1-4]|uniref:hypothetical protein n=1 Tax=Streptomyces sp. ME18-1-4 TaxID=3028685 RepID=UPI0029CAAB56
ALGVLARPPAGRDLAVYSPAPVEGMLGFREGEADGGGAEAPLTVECPVSVGAAELSPPSVEQPTRTSTPTAHTIAELRVSTTHSLSRRHLNSRHIRVPCCEFSRPQGGGRSADTGPTLPLVPARRRQVHSAPPPIHVLGPLTCRPFPDTVVAVAEQDGEGRKAVGGEWT